MDMWMIPFFLLLIVLFSTVGGFTIGMYAAGMTCGKTLWAAAGFLVVAVLSAVWLGYELMG